MVMQQHTSPMEDANFGLVGERPPSVCSNRPSLGTNLNHQPQKEACPTDWNIHKPDFNQTFSRPNSALSNPFKLNGHNHTQQRSRPTTPLNKNKTYQIDRTAFGSARSDISINSATRNRPSSGRSSRPNTPETSGRSSRSSYGKRGYYKPTSTSSYVDDTLFAKDKITTTERTTAKGAEFDYFGNKIISKAASAMTKKAPERVASPSNNVVKDKFAICGTSYINSLNISDNNSNASGSAKKIPFEEWIKKSKTNQHKILPTKYQVFSSSYVDETLFGPKPTSADFPAPWEKPGDDKTREKPFLFDSKNYSFSHAGADDLAVVRERGPYLRQNKVKTPVKPVWK